MEYEDSSGEEPGHRHRERHRHRSGSANTENVGVAEWEDRIGAHMVTLAWPIAVSMLSYATMSFVDTLFVSHMGTAELAGVGLATIACFTIVCFPIGFLRGAKVTISQSIGAGDLPQAHRQASAARVVALGIGFGMAIAGVLLAPLLSHLTETAASAEAATTYARIRLLGCPALFSYVALRESEYGFGRPKGPMRATLVSNAVNIGLDALFVWGLDMGVAGVAFATLAAHVTEICVLAWITRRHRAGRQSLRFDALRREFRLLREVGLPTGAQALIEVGAFATVTAMLANAGDAELAAHQIGIQVIHLTLLPPMASADAASVLSGNAAGASRFDLVPRVAVRAMMLGGTYAALASIALLLFSAPIASIFTEDPALIRTASMVLVFAGIFQVADVANVVAREVLRGAGDVRYAAIVGITAAWTVTPPLAYFLGVRAGYGAVGAWAGLCVEVFVVAGVFWARLLSGKWKTAPRMNLRVEPAE